MVRDGKVLFEVILETGFFNSDKTTGRPSIFIFV